MKKTCAFFSLAWLAVFVPPPAGANNVTFCYHQFDHSLENLYSVLPEVFDWQIAYIQSKGIPVVSQDQLVRGYTGKGRLPEKNIFITVDDGCKNIQNILPVLADRKISATFYLYPAVFDRRGYLTNSDLLALRANPRAEFGCHSYTHPILRHNSEETLEKEIVLSKQILEAVLEKSVPTFAYPFGMFDRQARERVGQNYQLAFGVNDGGNCPETDRLALNRFVIYKTTAFGEFMDMVDYVDGRERKPGYHVKSLGHGKGYTRNFIYTKVKIFQFPPEEKEGALLIVPSSEIGAGWIYQSISQTAAAGRQVSVMVNRNNNIPFYRPNREMKVIATWGMREMIEDLQNGLDFILAKKGRAKITLLTWGDGLDLILAFCTLHPGYQEKIQGVLAINPSYLLPEGTGDLKEALKASDEALENGEYASSNLAFFLKIKTLADLMIVKPGGSSPFAGKFGLPSRTDNRTVFLKALDQADHPDLAFDPGSSEYGADDFKNAFLNPLPVFSMVVPMKWERDLYAWWINGFVPPGQTAGHAALNLKIIAWCSEAYDSNLGRLSKTFPNLQWVEQYKGMELSTIELMLSRKFREQLSVALEKLDPRKKP